MDDIGKEIIKDFVLTIAGRIFRKAFGASPEFKESFHYDPNLAGGPDGFSVSWYILIFGKPKSTKKRWRTRSEIDMTETISVEFVAYFEFPKLTIEMSSTDLEWPVTYHQINLGNPESKEQITEFFTAKAKAIKKESKQKRKMQDLIRKKAPDDED